MAAYTQQYDMNGRFVGVVRTSDGATIPKDPSNFDYQTFLNWNASQIPPLDLSDRPFLPLKTPRSLLDIINDLLQLTGPQKNAVWSDLSAGTPKKYQTDKGVNAGAIASLDFFLTQTSTVWNATDLTNLRLRIVMCYVQDNPTYLVNPGFSPLINVPGDQL